jgi:hypothetical protein
MKASPPTFHDLMSKKLVNSHTKRAFIPFQKWTGWKTTTRPLMIQSFLMAERTEDLSVRLSVVRAYADDESETAWRDFFAFDYAGNITTLSELVVEIKSHPDVWDLDYPLDVTDYDTLIENLSEMVATDLLLRCHA